jgi:hypothetical protein
MSLCYLLSRIMEQLLTQGRIWEAAWKWGGKLKYPGNCPVLGYLSWSWNKEKEVMVPLYKSLSLPLRYSTSLQSKGYCYCLGVGEASWKKSVVWGNVKEAAFVLIRREGIRRGLKCLQTTAELKVLSVKLTEETAAVGPSWGAQAKDASLDPTTFSSSASSAKAQDKQELSSTSLERSLCWKSSASVCLIFFFFFFQLLSSPPKILLWEENKQFKTRNTRWIIYAPNQACLPECKSEVQLASEHSGVLDKVQNLRFSLTPRKIQISGIRPQYLLL